jgi:hypothetical protein
LSDLVSIFSQRGIINLFTVRHEPGRLCHVLNGHKGPVSALALDYDQKGFFSAGWDGEAIVRGQFRFYSFTDHRFSTGTSTRDRK